MRNSWQYMGHDGSPQLLVIVIYNALGTIGALEAQAYTATRHRRDNHFDARGLGA